MSTKREVQYFYCPTQVATKVYTTGRKYISSPEDYTTVKHKGKWQLFPALMLIDIISIDIFRALSRTAYGPQQVLIISNRYLKDINHHRNDHCNTHCHNVSRALGSTVCHSELFIEQEWPTVYQQYFTTLCLLVGDNQLIQTAYCLQTRGKWNRTTAH